MLGRFQMQELLSALNVLVVLFQQGVQLHALLAMEFVLLADTPPVVVAALLERALIVLPVRLEPTGWGALELQLDPALDVPPIIIALLAMAPPFLTQSQPAQLA